MNEIKNKVDNLKKAIAVGDNEYYTFYDDIENEIKHYKDQLKNKIIYCNCDGPESNFIKYFKNNFKELGIKKLIHSSSDFRLIENLQKMISADIIITNPPFSKVFREFVLLLLKYNKKFLIIGNWNGVGYKELAPFIINRIVKIGYTYPTKFLRPDKTIKKISTYWFTNLNVNENEKRELKLTRKFNKENYPHYVNYKNAIDVNRIDKIPADYYGEMGVPISIFKFHYEKYFKIVGMEVSVDKSSTPVIEIKNNKLRNFGNVSEGFCIKGNVKNSKYRLRESGEYIYSLYKRILIKRIRNENE